MLEKLKETAEFLGRYADQPIEWAVILGTGLGDLVTEIDVRHRIPYSQIPHFPVSTVEGHSGEMIFGYLGGKYIMDSTDASTTTKATRWTRLPTPFG